LSLIREAVHRFLCESPAALVGLSLDDLGEEREPVNVPGTSPAAYPSWSRRMHRTIDEIATTAGPELDACASRARP
jgi:4-alpha-glucanotransferase